MWYEVYLQYLHIILMIVCYSLTRFYYMLTFTRFKLYYNPVHSFMAFGIIRVSEERNKIRLRSALQILRGDAYLYKLWLHWNERWIKQCSKACKAIFFLGLTFIKIFLKMYHHYLRCNLNKIFLLCRYGRIGFRQAICWRHFIVLQQVKFIFFT